MKPNPHVKRVSARLHVLRFPAPFEVPAATPCLHCSGPLTLHQPDPGSPDRLLGVCKRCKHWYLIDQLPDLTEGVLMRLPGSEVLRDLSRENPSRGISLIGPEPESDQPGPIDAPGRLS